jgi:hypothetical protein
MVTHRKIEKEGQLADGRGMGVREEPNHRKATKPCPPLTINTLWLHNTVHDLALTLSLAGK